MELIDNVNKRLIDNLKFEIKKNSKIAIAASTFSIYAFEALKKELNKIDELRFVFTSPTFKQEKFQKESREFYIPHIYNEQHLCGGEFELRLKNELNQRAIAKERDEQRQRRRPRQDNKHHRRTPRQRRDRLSLETGRVELDGETIEQGVHRRG